MSYHTKFKIPKRNRLYITASYPVTDIHQYRVASSNAVIGYHRQQPRLTIVTKEIMNVGLCSRKLSLSPNVTSISSTNFSNTHIKFYENPSSGSSCSMHVDWGE
jgi:hypothetical protein